MWLALFCLVAVVCPLATAHSWLACTDYLEENGHYWDASLCRAFARHGHQYTPKASFGLDTGYNYFGTEGQPCISQRNDATAYNAQYPMAVYYPGQKVILVHPMKNHGADPRCTNQYIPDCGSWIYRGEVNAKSDVTLTQFQKNQVYDFGISPFGHEVPLSVLTSYPKAGFQNAARFCDNTDKAMATYTMTVPANLAPGRYTFLWAWMFHCGESSYTSCYEVDVVSTKAERDSRLKAAGFSTANPVIVPPVGGSNNVPPSAGTGPVTKVDGGWSAWTSFGACSKPCGGGSQARTRNCNNPLPQNGGAACVGPDSESQTCNTAACPAGLSNGFSVRIESNWGSGANLWIDLPLPKGSGTYQIQLPCALKTVDVWNSDLVSSQLANGMFTVKQTSWQLDKPDIGFTATFASGCPTLSTTTVKVTQV